MSSIKEFLGLTPDDNSDRTKNMINAPAGETRKIPIIQEEVQITKDVVESGSVRISKSVHEVEEMYNIPISYEEHDVQRITLNQLIDTAPPAIRYEGDTMIIPILREEVVVQKRLVLVEEVHVTKRQVEKTIQQPVTLLKEELNVERSTRNDTTNTNNREFGRSNSLT
jgi:uncharacterized protein (TIGR02271 family)